MTHLSYSLYTSVQELPKEWDRLREDEFLNIPYLTAQENALPKNMDVFYVAVYQLDKLVGKAIVQRVRIQGEEVYRNNPSSMKEELLNLLNINILCLGNLKLTGEHAYVYDENVDEFEVLSLLKEALNEIRQISKNEKLPIQLMGIKDFYQDSKVRVEKIFKEYQAFTVQPNMVFEFRKEWKSFDDYLDAMRTKYRTRAKRAFKKSEGIVYRELNLEEILRRNDSIYQLYLNVLKNADFSLYQLPENYFVEMKKQMPNKFKLFGGFKQDTLVSFYSIIENNEQLEAGFLGYDAELQKENQLYLNMLYQMICYGIDFGFDSLDLSRTAMEIKSSVGAEPIETFGLLKHTNPWMNKVLKSIFSKFYQPGEWIQRSPFKSINPLTE